MKKKTYTESNKALNAQKPAINKSMVAARRLRGRVDIYDPQYML